jgi:hypothetical protein
MLGKILTLDNLRKWHIINHLLLHCKVARELWVLIFRLFGVEWIVPKRVMELLTSWRGQLEVVAF